MILQDGVSAGPGREDRPRAGHHPARFSVLDGWRGVSILLVLAAHMLPLGPSAWDLNASAGVGGMSCFFTLSGFLIVTTIFKHPSVSNFLIRRLFRILPLAYTAMVSYLLIQQKPASFYPPHLAFFINYDFAHLTPLTNVFWSLCVEIHFYALAALILALAGLRGFLILPLLGLGFTGVKIWARTPHAIPTHLRIDEILVGATLGLIWLGELGTAGRVLHRLVVALPYYAWGALFAVASSSFSGPLQYAQPYFAGAMIGSSLLAPADAGRWLSSRVMRYIAEISYALYVIHPVSMYGWLGSGDKAVKYLKRPLCFAISFGLAHVSTFHFERHLTALGKHLSRKLSERPRPVPAPQEAA